MTLCLNPESNILKKIKHYNCDFVINSLYCLVKNIKKKFILVIKDFRIQLKNINDQNFVGCSNTTLKSKSLLNIINDINIKLIDLTGV